MRKYECNACEIRICTAEYQDGTGVPFKCTYITDRYCKPKWKEIERETAALPKLTAEVFDRPDCPEWAKYAAVSPYGSLAFFEEKPEHDFDCWIAIGFKSAIAKSSYDYSDWQNSLIERPKNRVNWDEVEEILCNSKLTIKEKKQELPDWCKPGACDWSISGLKRKIANGDRIRQMSNEGIAAFVCGVLNDRREETFRSVLDLINAPAEKRGQ